MTKTRLFLLLLLILLLIFLPKNLKADAEVPIEVQAPVEVKQIRVVAAPAIPLDPLQYQNYLIVEEYFYDDPVMIKIAQAESRFRCSGPGSKNPNSSASGCFQILKGTWALHKCTGDVFNAKDNCECAKKIKADSGTTPWNESKSVWSKL